MPADSAVLPSRKLLSVDVSSPAYSKYTATGNGSPSTNCDVNEATWLPKSSDVPVLSLSDRIEERIEQIAERVAALAAAVLHDAPDAERPARQRLDRQMQAGEPRLADGRAAFERDVGGFAHLRDECFVA